MRSSTCLRSAELPLGARRSASVIALAAARHVGHSAPVENVSVNGAIIAGQPFTVSFAGPFRESHGGYLAVTDAAGATVAILRGDGNPVVPM